MNKIYKYSIPTKEKYTIELPKGANIIRVENMDVLKKEGNEKRNL